MVARDLAVRGSSISDAVGQPSPIGIMKKCWKLAVAQGRSRVDLRHEQPASAQLIFQKLRLSRARAIPSASGAAINYRAADVMQYDIASDGPFDLIVMTETIYYLGWLYSFFDVGWLAHQLFEATREGGHLLLSNTRSVSADYLMRPWLIRTYHDLFANTGFHLECGAIFTRTVRMIRNSKY